MYFKIKACKKNFNYIKNLLVWLNKLKRINSDKNSINFLQIDNLKTNKQDRK